MKTSELFQKEIGYITNPTIQQIVADTLDASPECITKIPASSSGRYHPSYSLGEGGLVRHIKAAVGIAHCLIETENFKNLVLGNEFANEDKIPNYKDCAYAALILHDCMKPDDSPKHRTRFDHPILAAELFKETAKKYINLDNMEYMKIVISLIYYAVASHMGEWNTARYAKGIVLPKPQNGLDNFVHLCDYLGSRKFLDFNFDKYFENSSKTFLKY